MTNRHLLVVPCGAAPAAEVSALITTAQHAGWSAAVTATPSALQFLDGAVIERMTGAPPRTGFDTTSNRGQTRTVRKADAIIMAPATYNSINKLAAGIADTYALTVIAEQIGLAVPIVIVPFVNAALAARHPYRNALQSLRAEGVRILGPDHQWEPHEAGTGGLQQQRFPWQQAFALAAALADRAGEREP